MSKALKRFLTKLTVLSLSIFLSACATAIGPKISSEDERRAQASLLIEARAWQNTQEQRINEIGARLMRAAGNQGLLKFHFMATLEQTGRRIHPDSVNAWTDGEHVWITRGMIRFLKNDDELAIVLAHEMAHAYRGHMTNRIAKQALRLILGPGPGQLVMTLIEAATKEFDRDKEREADLYGIMWAYRAGFNVDGAKDLLKRMAVEAPESLKQGFLSSHPTSAERLLAMDRIAETLKRGLDPLRVIALQEEETVVGRGKIH